jgi:ABC-type nitrate/sulfonate/bicarbonate transport system substrate-binding protein
MNAGNKYLVTALAAALFAIALLGLYSDYGIDVADHEIPEDQPTLSDALWSDYAWAAVTIGIIIFAGTAGILALVGGEMKWR